MVLKCVETKKIKNPEIMADIMFNNFSYLTEFPHLSHNKKELIKINKCIFLRNNLNHINILLLYPKVLI